LTARAGPYWNYLSTSWKFPFIATVTFGTACQTYILTKLRLERRNQELQQAVESDLAHRELQEEELTRAREIQQALLPKEIPQIAGFDIAAAWEPSRIVGGDYFDVIRLGDKKTRHLHSGRCWKRGPTSVTYGESTSNGEGLCIGIGVSVLAV
jgi:hypothetical protein